MAYQLRSRGDPVCTESQEQTDTSGEHLTEHQVTTPSQTMFIPQQLSEIQAVALTTAEANRAQTMTDISTKPDVVTTQQLDTVGPTRLATPRPPRMFCNRPRGVPAGPAESP